MRWNEAPTRFPDTRIFAIVDAPSEDPGGWDVEPLPGDVLTESDDYDFFIVKAKHIRPDGTVEDGYLDVSLPERISDRAYFVRDGELVVHDIFSGDGEVISAVPIDCFGLYELFFSKLSPEIGIEVLEQGLKVSPRKTFIAEDLGYIFRDLERFAEAVEMFQISADDEPSSYFIYGELADCYEALGQTELAEAYRKRFENAG